MKSLSTEIMFWGSEEKIQALCLFKVLHEEVKLRFTLRGFKFENSSVQLIFFLFLAEGGASSGCIIFLFKKRLEYFFFVFIDLFCRFINLSGKPFEESFTLVGCPGHLFLQPLTNLIGFLSTQGIDVFPFVNLCNGAVGISFKDGGLEFLNGLSLILSYLLYQLFLLFKDVNHEVFTTFDVAVQHISNLV